MIGPDRWVIKRGFSHFTPLPDQAVAFHEQEASYCYILILHTFHVGHMIAKYLRIPGMDN